MHFDRLIYRRTARCRTRVASAVSCAAALLCAAACAPAGLPPARAVPSPPLPLCQPNLDGVITRAELPFVVGATAYVRVGFDVAVNTRGDEGQDGARVWDLSRPSSDAQPRGALTVSALGDQWFAPQFPDATLVGPLAVDNALVGALSITDAGVFLHGAASSQPQPAQGRTLLVYQQPVMLYPFPLQVGAHAQTQTQALGGVVSGIPFAVDDTTTIDVTAHGQLVLPDMLFDDLLRVTVRLQRVPIAGIAVQQVTHIFVNECLGEVARMVSPAVPLSETLDDAFPVAAEVWRLSF